MAELQLKRRTTEKSISGIQREDVRSTVFKELFSRHSAKLYNIALRKLGNTADAEDALQDALLSAFRHFDQFKGDAQISTWLTAIVLNTSRMQLRRRLRRKFVSLEAQDDEGFSMSEIIADTAPNPEQSRHELQLREVLEQVLVKVSPGIRPAFRLRVFEGLTTREAAARLGISEPALKAQFFRARQQITPHVQKAFASPVKNLKRTRGAHVRKFVPANVTVSREQCAYQRVA